MEQLLTLEWHCTATIPGEVSMVTRGHPTLLGHPVASYVPDEYIMVQLDLC